MNSRPQERILPPFALNDRIRLLRSFAGMTQTTLAKSMAGTQGWMSKVESGELEISSSQVLAIKQLFGISADSLLDGMIPYREIAARFRSFPLLPRIYSIDPNVSIRAAYPFVAIYEKHLSSEKTRSIYRALKLKPYVFADPDLPVNARLVWNLIERGEETGLFNNETIFQELATSAAKTLSNTSLGARLFRAEDRRQFLEAWIEMAKSMGVGHEFSIQSEAESFKVRARYPVPTEGIKKNVSPILDHYYKKFLERAVHEKIGYEWRVEMSAGEEKSAGDPNLLRTVNYDVSRK